MRCGMSSLFAAFLTTGSAVALVFVARLMSVDVDL